MLRTTVSLCGYSWMIVVNLLPSAGAGWPHHLIPQICRVPASTERSPKPPRPGAAPGRHGAAHAVFAHLLGMWLDKEGTCFASSLMRERYPPSPVLRTAVIFIGSCPGWPTVNRLSLNVSEGDPWSITTNSHHLSHLRHGFRSRSRRGTRLSIVSLTSASLVGTAPAAGSIFKQQLAAVRSTLGHEEDSQSAPLGTARHPERNRGARPLSLPVAQEQSL